MAAQAENPVHLMRNIAFQRLNIGLAKFARGGETALAIAQTALAARLRPPHEAIGRALKGLESRGWLQRHRGALEGFNAPALKYFASAPAAPDEKAPTTRNTQ